MKDINILAGATSSFGELWGVSPRKLVSDVTAEALKESGIKRHEIEAIFVGNMLSSSLGSQDHLGAFFSEELGLDVPAVKIEAACASGGMAVHTACLAVLSGQYETVLVVGVEKMTDHKPEEVASALMAAGTDGEREAGVTFPTLYALIARAHMAKYTTTELQMAAVSVKNHFHASLNSHAQFKNQITEEMVLKSPVVASPLKILDCSPITDGAASLILSRKKSSGKNIAISASEAATDSLGLAQWESLTSLKAAVEAAKKAYRCAAISPDDINVAEVHDCFSIAEIIA
ncbi:MAG: Acetyl-CoA acetyltransferase, partial [Candidatus Gottesmanbacteria bacterium GW2011_GWC2_42_8]